LNIASFLYIGLWSGFGIYVWQNAANFGASTDCNINDTVIFVVLGHNYNPMKSSLRGFALAVFSMGGVATLAALVMVMNWIILYAAADAEVSERNANNGTSKCGCFKGV